MSERSIRILFALSEIGLIAVGLVVSNYYVASFGALLLIGDCIRALRRRSSGQ